MDCTGHVAAVVGGVAAETATALAFGRAREGVVRNLGAFVSGMAFVERMRMRRMMMMQAEAWWAAVGVGVRCVVAVVGASVVVVAFVVFVAAVVRDCRSMVEVVYSLAVHIGELQSIFICCFFFSLFGFGFSFSVSLFFFYVWILETVFTHSFHTNIHIRHFL